MKIHIKGGRLIDPRSGVDAKKDVYIAAGRIVSIGDAPSGYTANRVIDATGLVVCPGFIDLHAHLREPGREDKETIATGTRAAAAAGSGTQMTLPSAIDRLIIAPTCGTRSARAPSALS